MIFKSIPTKNSPRFFEIDALRGIGILLVMVFHLFFDLNYFGILRNSMYDGAWLALQRTAAGLLILLVGVSLALGYERAREKKTDYYRKIIDRCTALFCVALLITSATWVYPHDGFIVFGIIHFIALSVFIGYFFLQFDYENLIFGSLAIIAGLVIGQISVGTNLLLWLGLTYRGFSTLDYFPLLPWFGLVLIGIFIGKRYYFARKDFPKLLRPNSAVYRILEFMGLNSLALYLIHQPILVGLIQLSLMLAK